MRAILFDTETTGLKPEIHHIISLGFIFWDSETGKMERFYQLLNWGLIFPQFSIPESTIQVHGITNEFLRRNGVHPVKAFAQLYDFIYDNCIEDGGGFDHCVAFNLPYDQNMVRSNLQYLVENVHKFVCASNYQEEFDDDANKCGMLLEIFTKDPDHLDENPILFIDSLIIDRIFHFDDDFNKVHHNLEEVGLRYGLGANQDAHNAMGDTERLVKVYEKQLEELSSLGISVDQKFETRLVNKYVNDNLKYDKKQLDYYGFDMKAVKPL